MTISERIETARRERRVLTRVSRAAWRLDQAERERTWAAGLGPRCPGLGEGSRPQGRRLAHRRRGERQQLALALGDLQDGTAAGLVVFKLDRLARDLIVQETLIAEVRKIGAELFTTAAGEADYLADDPHDPSRKLIRQVLGAVNEYERSMIVLRMKSGRKVKAAKGGYARYGSPAFGLRSVERPRPGSLCPRPLRRLPRWRDPAR